MTSKALENTADLLVDTTQADSPSPRPASQTQPMISLGRTLPMGALSNEDLTVPKATLEETTDPGPPPEPTLVDTSPTLAHDPNERFRLGMQAIRVERPVASASSSNGAVAAAHSTVHVPPAATHTVPPSPPVVIRSERGDITVPLPVIARKPVDPPPSVRHVPPRELSETMEGQRRKAPPWLAIGLAGAVGIAGVGVGIRWLVSETPRESNAPAVTPVRPSATANLSSRNEPLTSAAEGPSAREPMQVAAAASASNVASARPTSEVVRSAVIPRPAPSPRVHEPRVNPTPPATSTVVPEYFPPKLQ
jgi:hypothetical protein